MIVIEIVTQPEREGHFSIVQVSSTIEWITTLHIYLSSAATIKLKSVVWNLTCNSNLNSHDHKIFAL